MTPWQEEYKIFAERQKLKMVAQFVSIGLLEDGDLNSHWLSVNTTVLSEYFEDQGESALLEFLAHLDAVKSTVKSCYRASKTRDGGCRINFKPPMEDF